MKYFLLSVCLSLSLHIVIMVLFSFRFPPKDAPFKPQLHFLGSIISSMKSSVSGLQTQSKDKLEIPQIFTLTNQRASQTNSIQEIPKPFYQYKSPTAKTSSKNIFIQDKEALEKPSNQNSSDQIIPKITPYRRLRMQEL